MVAELKVELEQMRNRFELSETQQAEQAATLDKLTGANLELQTTVDQNHGAYEMRVASIEQQLRDVEKDKMNFIDTMGPRLQGLQAEADGIVNDAQRKFKEQDNQMGELMKEAKAKFEEAGLKYAAVNEKVEIVIHAADTRFRELAEELKRVNGAPHDNKKTGLLPDKIMVPKAFSSDILQ